VIDDAVGRQAQRSARLATFREDERTIHMGIDNDVLEMFAGMANDPTTPDAVLRAAVRALAQFVAHAQFAEGENSRAALHFAVRTMVAPIAARHDPRLDPVRLAA
jgi:hypothetical protein